MTFSKEVKEELSKINNLKDKNLVKFEFLGYLISKNTNFEKNKVKYSTENEYNINRLNKLLNNLNIKYQIEIKGNLYVIKFNIRDMEDILKWMQETQKEIEPTYVKDKELNNNQLSKADSEKASPYQNEEKKNNENNKELEDKALLRGAFLGGGTISEPNGKYHLDINVSNIENAKDLQKMLNQYNINVKILEGKSGNLIYIKSGEEISKILAFMGASNSVLKFEEIRVIKETRGKVNRRVNYEVANINKTINASAKQIEKIRTLKKNKKFLDLPDELKEIAEIRLKNPDKSLEELGKMLKNPIGKSGVNYRLNKIMKWE